MAKTISLDEFAGMKDTALMLMSMLYITPDDLKDPVYYERFEKVVAYLDDMHYPDILVRRITHNKNFDKLTVLYEYMVLQKEIAELTEKEEVLMTMEGELMSLEGDGEADIEMMDVANQLQEVRERKTELESNVEIYERI